MKWLRLIFFLLSLVAAPPPASPAGPPTGWAYHYRPGLMAQVARHRGMALQADVAGYAAVPDCRKVDPRRPWRVHVRWADGTVEWLQIVDCSDPQDLAGQRRKGLVLEVDAATARRHNWEYNYQTAQGMGKGRVWILGYAHP